MECNKEEALRAKVIAEKKMESKDFTGARKIALKAQQLYPDLENIAQMLVVCDVHCSAEQKFSGAARDWYKILQVEVTADDATIKKQYRKFALQLHPDKNKFAGAEAAFKLIGEAQTVLLDREKRTVFDRNVHRFPMYRNAMPSHHQQQGQRNFNPVMQTSVRPVFTNLNPPQQQPSRPPSQPGPGVNGGRSTFWTVCSFCSHRYEYYKEVLNRSLRCQHCNKPFIAYEVNIQSTTPTTNSSQQAFGQQNYGQNQGAFKAGVGSPVNLHAQRSNAEYYQKKATTSNASVKPNGKRRRKQAAESSEDSIGSTDSDDEDDILNGNDGFPDTSSYREEQRRRSTRQKHQVSYKENRSDDDDEESFHASKRGKGSASPCASGETSGEAAKLNNQNGLAADLKDDQKGVKQKQNNYAEDNLENTNVETKGRGKDAPGSSKIDVASERLTSKSTNGPDVFVYPDPEFSDFDKDKKEECFAAGQIWAIYDDIDGMPRFYATIRKVFPPGFKLEITWFEPDPDDDDEVKWSTEQLPISCGKYKLGSTETTEDHLMFSHLVLCQKIGRSIFKVYPRKGETWALFKNWDIKWYMDVESHRQYDMEIVEILSDYIEGVGVVVSYLAKLKGFVSLFCPTMKGANHTFQIPSVDLFRFSHRIPSFKMTGQERAGVPVGSYELDPVSLPTNLEEIDVPKDFEVKVGHTPSVGRSTRSSNMMKGDASTDKVKLDKSDSAEVTKDHVFRTNDGSPSVGRSTRSSNMMKGDTSTDKVKLDRRDSAEVRKDPVFRINDGSPSVGMNSRSSNMSKGDTSTGKVKLDRSDSAEVTEDPVFRINAGSGPLASVPVPGTIEIPDPVFFNFDKERSLGRFRIGQIWAFYSDEDGLPKYYGLIKKLRTGPDLELQVTFLTNCWLPEKAIRWEDNKMLISCGRFKIKAGARPCLYSDLNSVSHLVLASTEGTNKEYEIFPKRGEIWALYRKWTAKIKPSDLQTWEYDIVQILDVNDLRIAVVHLELVKGFPSVFKVQKNGGSAVTMKIPKAELLRFSHQIPAIKLTEKHGSVKGCCELDPGALPMHYFSQK
ncbi:uncharacterized protein LOC130722141 [Lotus japonicus]|uniref:uncharacterized protein LOC130722141 n=1 Tax=Lotus japonicus TaxID=34305 RepID=UPI00258AA530|nr:uncharacterized protein LOC130722141 [Lotus japonicus]XP_057428765.1 uncharacterized protein LOC130722141 [Lotus japonicus]